MATFRISNSVKNYRISMPKIQHTIYIVISSGKVDCWGIDLNNCEIPWTGAEWWCIFCLKITALYRWLFFTELGKCILWMVYFQLGDSQNSCVTKFTSSWILLFQRIWWWERICQNESCRYLPVSQTRWFCRRGMVD